MNNTNPAIGNTAAPTGEGMPAFPAAFTVHWPSGPVNCCVKHARALIGLGQVLGTHIAATKAPVGAECENCKNAATEQA